MALEVKDIISYGRQHTNGLHMPIVIQNGNGEMEIINSRIKDGVIVINVEEKECTS